MHAVSGFANDMLKTLPTKPIKNRERVRERVTRIVILTA
jgi:hypothetical protein